MICPKCGNEMQLRNGRFGEFYFCPNQYKGCKQKTITKQHPISRSLRCIVYPSYHELSGLNEFEAEIESDRACSHDPDNWFRPW